MPSRAQHLQMLGKLFFLQQLFSTGVLASALQLGQGGTEGLQTAHTDFKSSLTVWKINSQGISVVRGNIILKKFLTDMSRKIKTSRKLIMAPLFPLGNLPLQIILSSPKTMTGIWSILKRRTVTGNKGGVVAVLSGLPSLVYPHCQCV